MSNPSLFQAPWSRLMLGTVQFGLDYGVANQGGRPSYETICEILQMAHEGGVNCLDTAASYGQSEEVLGRALDDLGLKDALRVVTKVKALPAGLSRREAAEQIEASVRSSLERLRLEQLPLCLFHSQENIEYLDELLALRDKGLIAAAGVSLVDPEYARRALEYPELTAWQIPSNLLDRRYTHSGLTRAAEERGVWVFVRSLYLQGLLLMSDEATPPYLREVAPSRERLREIAARFDLSMAEMALRALLGRGDIGSLVVGVDSVAHMRENLRLVGKGPLPPAVLAELEAFVPDLPSSLISPPEWKERQRRFADAAACL